MANLLTINNLQVSFYTSVGEVKAVRGVDFELSTRSSLGIVGESGCGKSVTSLATMGLLQFPGKVTAGEIIFEGQQLLQLKNHEMRKIRGNRISMIFQDPLTCLNPLFTIGNQIGEAIREHTSGLSKAEVDAKITNLLGMVGIPDPAARLKQYAHEFSGGMRQRAMIAMALANDPSLLIADEPTTALDVTIQAQILELMKAFRKKLDMSLILITHDLGVVADICDYIKVMYAGKIAEEGDKYRIFNNPSHPYTWGLLKSIPNMAHNEWKRLHPIEGSPPDLIKPPVGCGFASRCKTCMNICRSKQPPFFQVAKNGEVEDGHRTACWLFHESAGEQLAKARDIYYD